MKLHRNFLNSIEEWRQDKPLSVVGATGSGKTSTVLAYLKKHNLKASLFSLDSIAAYKELDIGSSKPLGADRSDFNWQGIDIAEPSEPMNASVMRTAILPAIEEAKKNKLPIIFVGGTHFYERFILEGAAPGVASDPEFLKELQVMGKEEVYKKLSETDARWGTFLHVNDEYRIFRYGDLVLRQGLDYDTLRSGSDEALFPEVDCLVMNSEKEDLEPKLKKRIQEMLELGWVEETQKLIRRYGTDVPALKSIGYFEIVQFLTLPVEQQDFQQLSEMIFIRHRQLAKQQRTWLRKLKSKNE